jgi:aspartyl-tRNA(Asn)/glutamyl-tRNA(Gln) amidotransferase subunit C
MKINRKTVSHLEKLARIELDPDEVELITEQLGRIVEFVEQLQSVDTSGVQPTRLISQKDEEHLRDDEVMPGLERSRVMEQAPDHTDEFFRVPKVLGRGDES